MAAGRFFGTILFLGAGTLAVGAVIAAPGMLKASRPLVREGLRRTLSLYDRFRTSAAEATEDFEDLVAEVRAELATARNLEAAAAETPAQSG